MEIGNKAGNLLKLKKCGYNVPHFITLDTKESKDELYQKLKNWDKNTLFAVRSSCIAEDAKNKSFAGYFHSEIGVKYTDIYGAYKKVCESFKNHKGSVIIQEFIPSEKSGVLFTNDGNNNLIINSNVTKAIYEFKPNRYIYVGTACSFPRDLQLSTNSTPLVEEDQFPASPESGYGWSKLMGEIEAGYLAKEGITDSVILSLHNQ